MAARSHPAHGARRIGRLQALDGSRSEVRSYWRRVRICTDAPPEHLDPSGRERADAGARRPFVDRGERDVVRGIPGAVAEVLAAAEDVRWGARLLGVAPPSV